MVNFQTVKFHNDDIEIIDTFISVKKLCQNIGITGIADQYKKIKEDESFESKSIDIEINGVIQEVIVIPISKINGWLFSISVNKVKPEVKQKLIEYKKECFNVLNNYFNNGIAVNQKSLPQPTFTKEEMIKSVQQGLLSYFDGDKKIDMLIKQNHELFHNKEFPNTFTEVIQQNNRYWISYIEALRIDGSELQKWAISEIKKAKDERHEAFKKLYFVEEQHKRYVEKMKSFQNMAKTIVEIDTEIDKELSLINYK